ncbi:MAG: protein translocase subunit SecD [Clostridiales bacterium]|nr:protein translocase subunit SecD [Clostridiales bacterium]
MKKKSSIIKLCVIGVVLIIGLVLSFCPFQIGLKDFNSFSGNIKLGLDLKGGIYAEYVAIDDDTEDIDARMDGTVTSIQTLLVSKGYSEALVMRQGSAGIRVEVPDVDDPADILEILGEPAKLEFRLDDGTVILTGDDVVSASAGYYQSDWVVSLKLNSQGSVKFADATSNHVGETINTYVIYGENNEQLVSAATVNEAITGGQAIISGSFTQETAENLANQIMSGTFGVTLQLQKCDPISPTLGEGALKYGLIAGAIGLVLVMLFMCLNYRAFGFVASMALLLYTVMMLFLLSVIPLVQLTLPGIAGILLSIGMAIDGNVIIYERIKDEYANGKSILSATHYGYRKCVGAILDGNITTIIAAIILYIFGTGSVQGFALTLFVGIALAMFSSLVVTRGLINYVVAINNTNPKLYNLKRGKNYIDLSADQNDASVQHQIDEEQRAKDEKKKQRAEKKNERKLAKGGKVNE